MHADSFGALPVLIEHIEVRAVLAMGCLVVAAAGIFFALFHGSLWEAFVMMGMLGIGLGTTYAAIPGLIVSAVPRGETGSAMGFYQVVRYVGFSLGSALTASILASHNSSSTGQPTLDGYTWCFGWPAPSAWPRRSRPGCFPLPDTKSLPSSNLATARSGCSSKPREKT